MKKNINKKAKNIFIITMIASIFVLILGGVIFAAKNSGTRTKTVHYFSPNNDGNRDEFTIPLKISDKRYVMSWNLIIENEVGNIVRTIGNKEALPSTLTFVQFWKQLGSVKKGVAIPNQVVWNGAMDNGETAPDGMYYYYFTAKDDNGNESKTDKYPVVIDTVPPLVDVTAPSDKIFGEGDKTQFPVGQEGSLEDEWTGVIKNSKGNVVRTYKWQNTEPANFSWNGTNDNGAPVADGVYSYEISAEDRAGNKCDEVAITNIIFSAEKPVTSITLVGSKYFSPGTDSKFQDVKFNLVIPIPKEDSGNKLTKWSVKIIDTKTGKGGGKVYRTYNETTSTIPPANITFDGRDDKGNILSQGKYQAVVNASYLNGFEAAVTKSGEFILDTLKPNATLAISDKIFGAGAKTKTTISITPDIAKKIAQVPSWVARISPAGDNNKIVQEYNFGEFPPQSIDWDGFDKDGKLAADGKYKFEIRATDLAGNTNTVASSEFELNTKAASVFMTMSDTAFSPGTASEKKNITFTPFAKDTSKITEYTFTVKNAFDEVVRTIKNSGGLPENFVWDGKDDNGNICEDSTYIAALSVNTENGSTSDTQTAEFTLDTKPPYLEASSAFLLFSPDGDGKKDLITIDIAKCTSENTWHAQIKDSAGNDVKTFSWTGRVQTDAKNSFDWDGRDDAGNVVSDGVYSVNFDCEDEAGNKFFSTLSGVTVDNRETKAYITAENDVFGPTGNGILDTQDLKVTTSVKDGIDTWTMSIKDEKGNIIKTWKGEKDAAIPDVTTWDGKSDKGVLFEGVCNATLDISYTKGNEVSVASGNFICTTKPPVISVATTPKRFSPDNDGTDDELFIKLAGKSLVKFKSWSFEINDPKNNNFWTTKGTTSITEQITWDGLSNIQKDKDGKAERVQSATDYPYKFTVTDILGMTSTVTGIIPIDILVIRDGNLLKMAVPSIIFRSDNADFKTRDEVPNGIDPEIAKNNEKVLKRVAEVLNKFREYKVTIVGHANRVTDNENEETQDNPMQWGPALIPLSQKRAEFVRTYLKKKGVSIGRLTAEGKGGTQLIVDYLDKDNNWKNRRVEFILQK